MSVTTPSGPRLVVSILVLASAACSDIGVKEFNNDPEAEVTSHVDGDVVIAGKQVTFVGQVSDVDQPNTDLSTTWRYAGEAPCADIHPEANDGVVSCTITVVEGEERVTLEVTDDKAGGAAAWVDLEVIADAPPSVTIVSPEPGGEYHEGVLITFEGFADDPEDPAIDLVAEWTIDSKPGPAAVVQADGTVLNSVDLARGYHEVALTITDTVGNFTTGLVKIDVDPPEPPSVAIDSPGDLQMYLEGDVVEYEAAVTWAGLLTDTEVAWSSGQDGLLGTVQTGSDGVNLCAGCPQPSDGVHVISATVSAPSGEFTIDTVKICRNPAPSAPVVTFLPADPTVADVLEADAMSDNVECLDSDFEADTLTYTYEWKLGATVVGYDPTLDLSGLADAVTVTVTPNDGHQGGPPATASVTLGNSPPTMTALDLGPPGPRTADDLVATAVTSDLDGDLVTVDYEWFVDGASVLTEQAGLLPASYTARDLPVYVVATPTDGIAPGAGMTSAVLTIGNTAPEAPGVAVTPAGPAPGADDLLCSITPSADVDGDTVDYQFAWTVDGAPYAGATTTTYPGDTVPGAATATGETWTCTVTPSDGTDTGPAGIASVSVDCELSTWYADADSDTYGDPGVAVEACEQPAGTVDNALDCDDTPVTGAGTHPGAPEVPYDDIDQDCHEGDLVDVDGDGWDAAEVGGEDCDDALFLVNPDQVEVFANGLDDDCDPATADVRTEPRLGVLAGGGTFDAGGLTVKVSVGDPVSSNTLTVGQYTLRVGIGTTQTLP